MVKGTPVITVEQLRQHLAKGGKARLPGRQAKGPGKYGNTVVWHMGQKFDSRAELAFELYLNWLESIGKVAWHTRQVPFWLPCKDELGRRAKRYVCDFMIKMPTGPVRLVDVKGAETKEFKIKKSVIEGTYPVIIELVEARTNGDYAWI